MCVCIEQPTKPLHPFFFRIMETFARLFKRSDYDSYPSDLIVEIEGSDIRIHTCNCVPHKARELILLLTQKELLPQGYYRLMTITQENLEQMDDDEVAEFESEENSLCLVRSKSRRSKRIYISITKLGHVSFFCYNTRRNTMSRLR